MGIDLSPAAIAEQIRGLEEILSVPEPDPAPTGPASTGPAGGVGQRPQAQGDLLFVPGGVLPHWAQPITAPVPLIVQGNGHVLDPSGPGVRWAPIRGDLHVIGVVEVAPGAVAVVRQPRGVDAHTPLTLTAGRWTVRRQTEVTTSRIVRHVQD